MATVAILLTCHNRKNTTLDCLRHLHKQQIPSFVRLQVYLVDDGSTDGTAEAVAEEFPDTRILQGSGDLFWCGGMRAAWSAATADDPDYYLLANDDTLLFDYALEELLKLVDGPDSLTIGVAAIRDPACDCLTYGGIRGTSTKIPLSGRPEECDTFNANCALVTRAVFRRIGMLHHAYTHAMGDFDYGYLATRSEIRILQSAGFLGTCSHNSSTGSWCDRSLTRRERFRHLQSPKGLPWREWVTYNRRNAGWIWPWKCVSPLIRILLGR